ncbi:MAG: 1-acyl-sn-glycerol-3-phosphate acyltransferase [Muribaculaceae bacterium]|nr:1-acyl-sn-glycerol-3-phosphate acyltransferase [Muribaculaceae bacterium]
MDADKPISINITEVVRSRLGDRSRFVPRFALRYLERLICQDKLNNLLKVNFPKRDSDFCDGVLSELGVTLKVRGEENLPADSRIIIASNHPLGGLDGISMISFVSRHYGKTALFVVNDLLMAVEPLRDCFIPVNKLGAQSRKSAQSLDKALSGDSPVVIYPSGLCSRLQPDGSIADLAWNKMFINKAIESHRDIVPVFFDGRNSRSFYRTALWRKRLGIRFNLEMALLPREVFRSAGRTFTLTIGKPIRWQELEGGSGAAREALRLREIVYNLKEK